jgi:3-dehydro-4-phosphotetronate decarboxylase
MTNRLDQLRAELKAAGEYMLANGLAWGNAGNISARHGDDSLVVTASGTHLGKLAPEDLVVCPLNAAEPQPPGCRPSKEMPMHRAVYAARPEIGAVLHASPIYGTLLACTGETPPSDWFVEDMYYLERVARVPYRHPGSQALGEAVAAAARRANILLLENHGVLVYDIGVREALMALHTLEMACQMLLTARASGLAPRPVSPDVVADFLASSGYRPRRTWPGEEPRA